MQSVSAEGLERSDARHHARVRALLVLWLLAVIGAAVLWGRGGGRAGPNAAGHADGSGASDADPGKRCSFLAEAERPRRFDL